MGIAGIAMLGAFVGLIMTLVTSIRYVYWQRTGLPAVGTFGEIESTYVEYKSDISKKITATHYTYQISILCDGCQYESTYTEVVSGDSPSKIYPGEKINLLWNFSSEKYFKVDDAKKSLKQYPLMLLVCIAVFVVCALIATALA